MGVKIVLAVAIVFVITSPAAAVRLAYEPFNLGSDPSMDQYTVGPLAGQNPTNSFFTGAWQIRDSGAANANVLSTGLSYLGSPSIGGAIQVTPNGTPFRSLASVLDATTVGTYYIGFDVNFGAGNYTDGTDGNDMGYRAIEFRGSDGTFQFGVAYNAYNGGLGAVNQDPRTGRMVLDHGSLQIIDGSPDSFVQENGTTHLIILKLVLSAAAASDAVTVYLDPTNAIEPDIAGATFGGADVTLGSLGNLTIYGGSGTFPVLDELRVGTTFADAAPAFPTPGDTDGDGDVDLVDYQHIVDHMGLRGQSTLNGDIAKRDGTQGADGVVDINDFRLWKLNYPHSPGAGAGSGQVPEPSALLLVLAGAALSGIYAMGFR
jgi:hypothetical protein